MISSEFRIPNPESRIPNPETEIFDNAFTLGESRCDLSYFFSKVSEIQWFWGL